MPTTENTRPYVSTIQSAEAAKKRILSVPADTLTKTFLEEMFAAYHDRETQQFHEANYDPTSPIILHKNEYQYIKEDTETTLGTLVFNRYVLERCKAIQFLGYWNEPLFKKNLEKLNTLVNNLVISDKLTTTDLANYIDSRDRLGFWCAGFLSVSITPSLIRPMHNVNQRKHELFQQYQQQLNSQDPVEQIMTVNKIEKELMGMVRENLKSDSGYDLYASGDGNLDNNYKTINVMRGAVYNGIKHRYDIVENSLMDGITKKDIPSFSNSVTAAAYPSAVGTAKAGYMSKQLLALLQSEHLDPNPNSDCGTQSTIPFTVTKSNKQYVLFRYININGKRGLITLDNVDKLIGKTVRLYSPQCCTKDAICGKCAGLVFHNLNVTRVGLLTSQITQKLLNIKLKSKHDLSQNAGIIPIDKIFLHKNQYCTVNEDMLVNHTKMKMFIPKFFDDYNACEIEATSVSCMGVIPVKFLDKEDNVILSTIMTVPTMLSFNLYNDMQEDVDNYIITYEPESQIASVGISKSAVAAEFFINQIYLNSRIPQIPYNLLTEMMFQCLEINGVDLTGPSIIYELLARRVCRKGSQSFAKVYGKDPNVDQMSYEKLPFRKAVQSDGALQSVMFEALGDGINVSLANTLNGIEPTPTPLETIIKA